MLQMSQAAVTILDAAKREFRVPDDFAIRVSGAATPHGELGVHISFADAPEDGDVVDEQHGARLFVAADVVEPLADSELDVSVAAIGNGSTPAALILRPQHTDEE